VDDLLRN